MTPRLAATLPRVGLLALTRRRQVRSSDHLATGRLWMEAARPSQPSAPPRMPAARAVTRVAALASRVLISAVPLSEAPPCKARAQAAAMRRPADAPSALVCQPPRVPPLPARVPPRGRVRRVAADRQQRGIPTRPSGWRTIRLQMISSSRTQGRAGRRSTKHRPLAEAWWGAVWLVAERTGGAERRFQLRPSPEPVRHHMSPRPRAALQLGGVGTRGAAGGEGPIRGFEWCAEYLTMFDFTRHVE